MSVMRVWLRLEFEQLVAVGTAIGAILAVIIYSGISDRIEPREVGIPIYILLLSILSLLGMQVGSMKARERKRETSHKADQPPAITGILDTSVIIDGRIADICETGFLSGDLIIPERTPGNRRFLRNNQADERPERVGYTKQNTQAILRQYRD